MHFINGLQSQHLSCDVVAAEGTEKLKASFSLAYYASSPPAFPRGDGVLRWRPRVYVLFLSKRVGSCSLRSLWLHTPVQPRE